MASQDSKWPPIDFSITSPFRSVRLMEVPEDLLEIIASSKREGGRTSLKFKSSPPPTVTTTLSGNFATNKSKDSVLHLCSDEKAWAVKQVSTSNSMYLIQPQPSKDEQSSSNNDKNTQMVDFAETEFAAQMTSATRGSITAVAQVGSFLELQIIKADEKEIERNVRDLVTIYEPPSITEHQLLSRPHLNQATTKDDLFNNIPAPDSILSRVCSKLCLFELDEENNRKTVRIPSSSALLQVWSKVIEGCAIDSFKFEDNIDVDHIKRVLEDETCTAIAGAIFEQGGMLDVLNLTETGSSPRELKYMETARFIATLILKSQILEINSNPDSDSIKLHLSTQEFLQQWSNLLPTAFAKYCTLENLESIDHVVISNDENGLKTITWTGSESMAAMVVDGTNNIKTTSSSGENSTKPAATGKRKWHEKFGAQRQVKR